MCIFQVKEEPASPQHMLQLPPSPDETRDIWDLLCGSDVKPSIKVSLTQGTYGLWSMKTID